MSAVEHIDLEFLFFAYSGVWIIMFGFMYRMMKRTRQLEQEVEVLVDAFHPGTEAPIESGFKGPSV